MDELNKSLLEQEAVEEGGSGESPDAAKAPGGPRLPPIPCANCIVYRWDQPDTSNSRCGKCKVVRYCSKECQSEHWHKVHRKHCKFLSGVKKAAHSEHSRETCAVCREADKTKGKITSKQTVRLGTNSTKLHYGCVLEDVMGPRSLLSPHPFPLAGLPGDRMEKAIIVLLHVVFKIRLTWHEAMNFASEDLEKLCENLSERRRSIWMIRKIFPEPTMSEQGTSKCIDSFAKILGRTKGVTFKNDQFQLWETFNLVQGILLFLDALYVENMIKDTFTALPEELKNCTQRVRESSFLARVDQVLEVLTPKLVPFNELVNIVCEFNVNQQCSICFRDVVIKDILCSQDVFPDQPAVLFNPVLTGAFGCGSRDCWPRKPDSTYIHWVLAVDAVFLQHKDHRCDVCFRLAPLREVHRCRGCLTKNYCSQACLLEDWHGLHGELCGRQVGARKVKQGARERRSQGREKVKEKFARWKEYGEEGDVQRILDKISGVKLRAVQSKPISEVD